MKIIVAALLALAMTSAMANNQVPSSEEKLDALFKCPESVADDSARAFVEYEFDKVENELHRNWSLQQRVQYRVHLIESHHCAKITALDHDKATGITTLCNSKETPIFSCGIGEKTVSLCESEKLSDGELALHYRYGFPGKSPEFEYPKEERPASTAFTFTNIGGPIWVVSFGNKNAKYDLLSDLEGLELPSYPFIGLEVAVGEAQSNIRACNKAGVVMDMWPLQFAGYYPESGRRKTPISKFKIVRKEISHGPKWKSKMEYPIIGDQAIDAVIKAFMTDDCNSDGTTDDDGNCSQTVNAEVIRKKFLNLTFDNFEYATGSPHGQEEFTRRAYMKVDNHWVAIADDSPLANSDECHALVSPILYRMTRPQLSTEQAALFEDNQDNLLEMATQVITEDGIRFEYAMYTFNARSPPDPVLVSYKTLGACFDPKPEPPHDDAATGKQ